MSLIDIASLILLISAFFYCLVLISLVIGLVRIPTRGTSERPFVSVIIAARNEGEHISALLQSLTKQTYHNLEIIIIDDQSTDDTLDIANKFAKSSLGIRVLTSESPQPGVPRKKAALTRAISASNGEVLLFTDADCIPGPNWVMGLVEAFLPDVGLVAGYSPYEEKLLSTRPEGASAVLQRFIRYEEIKGALWSAGAIGLSRGWLCTGRNLAYRRVVWDEVGGFSSIMHSISGDDDLFLQLVRRRTQWKIRYVRNPKTFVPTVPPKTFSQFVEQRKRHFSAGKYFSFSMKAFSLSFHSSNFILAGGILAGVILGEPLLSVAIASFLFKCMFDLALAMIGSLFFARGTFPLDFLFMEIIYIFYSTIIGPLGIISSFEWKPELPS